jgi:protein phosphatase
MDRKITTASEFLDPHNKRGFLVVGDVHAKPDEFGEAIAYARNHELFVIQLGDLVDRGHDNVTVLEQAVDLVETGDGMFLKGNHDWKHIRHMNGADVVLHKEHQRTVEQLQDSEVAVKWLSIAESMPFILVIDSLIFAHAGFAANFLDIDYKFRSGTKAMAIYGEVDKEATDHRAVERGYALPVRTYTWVKEVPTSHKVFVGHSVLSNTNIIRHTNENGGQSFFTDTGCGFEKGCLSWVHLDSSGEVVTSSVDIVERTQEELETVN